MDLNNAVVVNACKEVYHCIWCMVGTQNVGILV